MPTEQLFTLGLALGCGVLASALARRVTGHLFGYLMYAGIQLVGMISAFAYLYLSR